jgi:hypothetical protein
MPIAVKASAKVRAGFWKNRMLLKENAASAAGGIEVSGQAFCQSMGW